MSSFSHVTVLLGLSATVCACGGGGSGPRPPTANAATLTLDEDTSAQGTLSGTANDGGALTIAIASQPANGTLTSNGATYTYTPNADYFGSDSFTFTVSENGRTSSPATVSITVNNVNDAPTSAASAEMTDEDTALQAELDAADVDGDSLTITIIDSPMNGAVTLSGGTSFSYQPAQHFFGQDTFTYTVNDGAITSAVTAVTIDVTSVNDAPVLVDVSRNVEADSTLTVDMRGTDVENDPLTYAISSDFAQAAVTNDPTTTGLFDLAVPYGTYGSDQAGVVANDGIANSSVATIDLDITVPQTTPTTTFQTYDGQFSLSIHAFAEGANDSLYVVGSVFGEIENPSANSTERQFVAIHDATGARVDQVYLGGARLESMAAGFNNDAFAALGVERDTELTVRTIGLDINNNPTVDLQAIIPYATVRASKSLLPIHIPGVGFYILANDNQLTWVDYAGVVQSTVPIPDPLTGLVNRYVIDDVRIVNDVVYVAGSLFECQDDGSQCSGGTGTRGYVLTADRSGTPLGMIQLSGFPDDVAVLNDGSVASFSGPTLKRVDTDGTELWSRTVIGTRGLVATNVQGDIFLWTYGGINNVASMVMTRVSMDNALVWETDEPISIEGGPFFNDMSVDQFGNTFLSFIQQVNVNQLVTIHFDYSGQLQWTEISAPSDISANFDGSRKSFLSNNYRYISVAEDFAPGEGPDNDGFVFFTAIEPAPQ